MLAARTILSFPSGQLAVGVVQLPTADEFNDLGFGCLTFQGRDRQRPGDEACRIPAGRNPHPAELDYLFLMPPVAQTGGIVGNLGKLPTFTVAFHAFRADKLNNLCKTPVFVAPSQLTLDQLAHLRGDAALPHDPSQPYAGCPAVLA